MTTTQDKKTLNHFDESGKAHMVDISDKGITHRVATAQGTIQMQAETFAMIKAGDAKKGDVLGIARIAAIQASKKTAELIPLCHPIALSKVSVTFTLDEENSRVTCLVTAKCDGKTGVEMEALTATSAGLLTIYDMCKAIDRGMTISEIKLLEKLGGKTGHWKAD